MYLVQLFKKHTSSLNQIHIKRPEVNIKAEDLLQMPSGGVTLQGLKHNIGVGIYFIRGWLQGKFPVIYSYFLHCQIRQKAT